jgi:hypothetical protein
MRDDIARNRNPSPVIAIAAISVFTRPVEIFFAELLGDGDHVVALAGLALSNVTRDLGKRTQKVYFCHSPALFPSSWALASPVLSGV